MNYQSKKKKISPEDFDRKFSEGEDMSNYIDWSKAIKRINLDIPAWAVKQLDAEASRRGITRQSLIKTWVVDRLDQLSAEKNHAV